MEAHPSFHALSTVVQKYPHASGSLFQVYNDLNFAQRWDELVVIDLEDCSRAAFQGKKPGTTETVLHVVPCSITETLSLSWLHKTFSSLSNPSELYLAITSDDSSIVYYKISRGIVKPPM